jgi:hypothetical protein
VQPENMLLILTTFSVFQFDISGKLANEEHLKNIPFNLVILFVFHIEIFGIDINEEQS